MERKGYHRGAPQQQNSAKSSLTDKKDVQSNNNKPWVARGGGSRRRDSTSSNLNLSGGGKQQPDCFPSSRSSRQGFVDKRPRARDAAGTNRGSQAGLETHHRDDIEPELGSVFVQGSKKQSLNHLLNFHYEPRDKGGGVATRGVDRNKGKANGNRWLATSKHKYNKEHFLQANCQFVVKSTGDYSIYFNNPDVLVDWDLIEQINVQVDEEPSCPICLYSPSAGKMTRCGHVYCWSCILHYLALSDKTWRKCPICYEAVHQKDLKSVVSILHQSFSINDTITFTLMKRARGSLIAYPIDQYPTELNSINQLDNSGNDSFTNSNNNCKLVRANGEKVAEILKRERFELERQMREDGPCPESCFVQQALEMLEKRELCLKDLEMLEKKDFSLKELSLADNNDSSENNGDIAGIEGVIGGINGASLPIDDIQTVDGSIPKVDCLKDSFTKLQPGNVSSKTVEVFSGEGNCSGNETGNSEKLFGDCKQSIKQKTVDFEKKVDGIGKKDDFTGKSDDFTDKSDDFQDCGEKIDSEVSKEGLNENAATFIPRNSGELTTTDSANGPIKFFYFYQASDGQHIYLHAINARMLENTFGSLEFSPRTISGKIVEKEGGSMTEELRNRIRCLQHLPLTCQFEVAEIELTGEIVSEDTLYTFKKSLDCRQRLRRRRARDERARDQKIQEAERRAMGRYPSADIHLESRDQFPQFQQLVEEHFPQHFVESRARTESEGSLSSSLGSVDSGAVGGGGGGPSFAKMLSSSPANQKRPQWPGLKSEQTTSNSVVPSPRVRCDSSEPEVDDYVVHAPSYNKSFSDAIAIALEKAEKNQEQQSDAMLIQQSGKKKKKTKQKVLFATSMSFGGGGH